MYLLDTNVLSELRKVNSKQGANASVVRWANPVPPTHLFLSVITIFEIELGIAQLLRRDAIQGERLRHWLQDKVLVAFEGRILSIDLEAARICAALHVPNPKSYADSLIAATAMKHGLTLVTRNIADFTETGVKLFNPWDFLP